jgi:hypothetical protein
MREAPLISNAILVFMGLATFLGMSVLLINYEPDLSGSRPSDDSAPEVADLSFNVTYKAADRDIHENQKWWTLGTSNWVLTGSVINNSNKDLTRLKFELVIKYGANIIGDEAVATQHGWKVPPGQERAFTTSSNNFRDLPPTKRNPIWGIKLIEINNTPVKTDIVWSADNPSNQFEGNAKEVKTLEVMPK